MDQEKKNLLSEMLTGMRQAHENFYAGEEHDYELMPMYLLYRGAEIHTVVGLADMPQEPAHRSALAQEVRRIAEQQGCDGFAFNSEGWTLPPQNMDSAVPGESFAERPDRVEILMVNVGTHTGEQAMQTANIVRKEGESVHLYWNEPVFPEEEESLQSRMNPWFSVVPEGVGRASHTRH